MKTLTFLFAGFLAAASALHAELAVDPIYQADMVLQRAVCVPICGTSDSAEPITVSFAGQSVQAAVEGGRWQAVLAPMEASAEGRTLTITQGEQKVALENVLVGEVWIASGQSNMFWRLEQTGDRRALEQGEIPAFRYYQAEPQVLLSPRAYPEEKRQLLRSGDMYRGGWCVSTPPNNRRMSAVGWYFGRKLQELLGVPVGVVHVSLGASEMAAWVPPAVLREKYPDCLTSRWMESPYVPAWCRGRGKLNLVADPEEPHPFKPGYLYSTGIAPWVNFPVAGVIWYQGEADAETNNPALNCELLADMIKGWRADFHKETLPFCMVQLPRIRDNSPLRAYWPEFREVQHRVSQLLPAVYYVTTIDLGMTNNDVHPPRKLEVGERLAALAAARVYGCRGVPYSGPAIAGAEAQGEKVVVHYHHASGLKTTDGAAPVGFELSEDGQVYHAAAAELRGESVELSCPELKHPQYVRYAWAVFLNPNLINDAGLPAVPFCRQVEKTAEPQAR